MIINLLAGSSVAMPLFAFDFSLNIVTSNYSNASLTFLVVTALISQNKRLFLRAKAYARSV